MNNEKLDYIDKNLYTLDSFTSVKKEEAKYIYKFLIENSIHRTLEIGLAFGRSAAYIISATDSKHIAIDPFQIRYQNAGIKNLQMLGFEERFILKADYSHNILPSLLKEDQKFDFIFIDGSHRFDGIFIDFYYSDLLLEKNGYILFHDSWMRTVQLVISYIKTNRKNYKFIKTPLRNLIMIQKVGDDYRSWSFHKEFFTLKSLISHNINMSIHNGKHNFLKSLISKMKDKGLI